MFMTRCSRLAKRAFLALLIFATFAGIMIYRAQRYERAYERIPLGMPFGEAEVILESLPGRYDEKQLGKWVFVKDGGAFHIGKDPMTHFEIGPGRTDYANSTGEVWGRSRI
jgi:hypothetical protein